MESGRHLSWLRRNWTFIRVNMVNLARCQWDQRNAPSLCSAPVHPTRLTQSEEPGTAKTRQKVELLATRSVHLWCLPESVHLLRLQKLFGDQYFTSSLLTTDSSLLVRSPPFPNRPHQPNHHAPSGKCVRSNLQDENKKNTESNLWTKHDQTNLAVRCVVTS